MHQTDEEDANPNPLSTMGARWPVGSLRNQMQILIQLLLLGILYETFYIESLIASLFYDDTLYIEKKTNVKRKK